MSGSAGGGGGKRVKGISRLGQDVTRVVKTKPVILWA